MVEQNHLASTEWVDIVSEENEVIAQASREQMRAERLRHRTFRYGYLVTTSPQLSVPPSAAPSLRLGH